MDENFNDFEVRSGAQRDIPEESGYADVRKEPEMNRDTRSTLEKSGQDFRDAVDKVKGKTSETVDMARQRGMDFIGQQQQNFANEIGEWGVALHDAANRLNADHDMLAPLATQAADYLDSASHYLHEKSLDNVLHDVNNFTRQHPALTIGGLFVAGLAVSRFFKASPEQAHKSDYREENIERSGPGVFEDRDVRSGRYPYESPYDQSGI